MDIKNIVITTPTSSNDFPMSEEDSDDELLPFKSFLSSTRNGKASESDEEVEAEENMKTESSSSIKQHIADVSTILLNVLLRKDSVPSFSKEQKLRILRTINERPEVFEKLSESIDELIGKKSTTDELISVQQKISIKCFHVPNIVLLIASIEMISSIQNQYQYQAPDPIMVWCIAGAILDEFTRDYKQKERQNILTTLKMSIALLNIRQPKEQKQVKTVKRNMFSNMFGCFFRSKNMK
jgi:hypothetical protein